MTFIQRYVSPDVIGVGDKVRFKNNDFEVLINYIKGDKAVSYTHLTLPTKA